MLLFRVGIADETLPTRGITHLADHLAEHLALDSMPQRLEAWRSNGQVEPFRTRFMVSGSPSEITTFLAELTSNLSELPTARFDDAKRVLRTEAARGRKGSPKERWSYR